jgi:hypothetical protein
MYADHLSSGVQYICGLISSENTDVSNKSDTLSSTEPYPFYVLRLGHDEQVVECLRVALTEHELSHSATLALAQAPLPAGSWLCTPVLPQPSEFDQNPHPSERLWLAALERAVQDGDRTVAAVMSRWRYILALRARMPWREIADLDGRMVLTAMNATPALVRRLAARFRAPIPGAYHADETDLAVWGSLHRVEQEFDRLQQLVNDPDVALQPAAGSGHH